jgi:exodeoxyribonuclease V gamma subunit
MDFDLMARDHRAGDRSRREDDRYLFLEALLSARDHLHVSWVGRSILDNEPRPPSVLVAQLRDHIAAGWQLAAAAEPAPDALLAALTVEHRLQPFHPAYFDGKDARLASHAREWRASLSNPPQHAASAPLSASPDAGTLTLQRLGRFLKDPIAAFFEQRLGVHLDEEDAAAQDIEPFLLDGLGNWQLQDELIRAQKAAVDAGRSREDALEAQLARIAGRGELPHGPFAAPVLAGLAEPMQKLFADYEAQRTAWPYLLPDEPLEHEEDGVMLEDWLTGLRGDAAGNRCRLVLESSSLVKDSKWRFERLLPHWAAHLAGHLQGQAMTSVILSKAGSARLPELAMEEAREGWSLLLHMWREGLCRPLPFSVPCAAAWLRYSAPENTKKAADGERARAAARAAHEQEVDRNAYLRRAFPRFETLWGEEAEDLAHDLLAPLRSRAGSPKGDKEAA